MRLPYLHVRGGLDRQTVYCTLKTEAEVREHFAKYAPEALPVALPESFSKLEVWYGADRDGDSWEAWFWGEPGADENQGFFVDYFDVCGRGIRVEADGRELFNTWEDLGEGEGEGEDPDA